MAVEGTTAAAGKSAGLSCSERARRSSDDGGGGDLTSQRRAELHPAVLAAAKRGDAQAFAEILQHHDRELRLLAFRLLGDQGQMEDALQDAAIKAYRALHTFKSRSAVGTWLYRIVYTTCLDHLRRRPAPLERPAPAAGEAVDPDSDPLDRLIAWEQLDAALAALPPDQRVALLLIDQEGYDYRTAGEIIGVPAGTVSSRVSTARATVRRLLTEADERGGER
jgi:RNA polymerase sigma-70 factor, ECF subfamily